MIGYPGTSSVVLRRMGFAERTVDPHYLELIVKYVVYYNHQMVEDMGFCKSQRGVKQGDPILPSLFIIAAEVLSRMLNSL